MIFDIENLLQILKLRFLRVFNKLGETLLLKDPSKT